MKNLFLLLISIIVLSISCSKDIDIKDNGGTNSHKGVYYNMRISDNALIDQRLDEISKITAIAQKNSEFRSILLNKAKQNVGTENAILYLSIKNNSMPNLGINVDQFFKNISDSLGFTYDLNYFDCQLVDDMPQLTFFLYITSDNLEIGSVETWPKSVVLPETYDFDEVADFSHDAYDQNLQTYLISNNTEPEDQLVNNGAAIPYFIIVANYDAFIVTNDAYEIDDSTTIWDRMGVENPTQEMEDSLSYAKTSNNEKIIIDITTCNTTDVNLISYYGLRAMINRLSEEDYDPIPPPPPGNCPRDAYDDREELVAIQIEHQALKQFSKWLSRWAEFKFSMIMALDPTLVDDISDRGKIIKRRKVKKDKFFILDKPLSFCKWKYLDGDHGNPYKLNIIGISKHTGDKRTLSVGIGSNVSFKDATTGISATHQISSKFEVEHTIKDKILYSDLVYYCDPIVGNGTKYSTGLIDFWMREHN